MCCCRFAAIKFFLIESMSFKPIYQQDCMDCGSACLAMIARHYGCHVKVATIRWLCGNSRNGLSMLSLNKSARQLGFETKAVRLSFDEFCNRAPLPCIVHWQQKHFVVVYKIADKKVFVADPAVGRVKYSYEEFKMKWTSDENGDGFALLLEPAKNFISETGAEEPFDGFKCLWRQISSRWRSVFIVLLTLVASAALQLLFPFLTQVIVDDGIGRHSVNLLIAVLGGQILLAIGSAMFLYIQNRFSLYVGASTAIRMVHDFLLKLVRLPISFFDTRRSGDILQRIGEHHRIELFVSNTFAEILLSFFTLIVMGAILCYYSFPVFAVFVISSIMYIVLVSLFLNKRRLLDNERFALMSKNQDEIIQYVRGMMDIKLNNCHKYRLRIWGRIQDKLFKFNVKSLNLSQKQRIGGILICKFSDIIILFISALSVIDGEMTLGEMLAIQYMLGSVRVPVEQLATYVQTVQDVLVSYERVNAVLEHPEEKSGNRKGLPVSARMERISFRDMSFSYETGVSENFVIKNVSFDIEVGKTTAIVGISGSGKTTLLKLLLGFYKPQRGGIFVDEIPLGDYDIDAWRGNCGVVMQDGYIFSDTVAANIAVCGTASDIDGIRSACKIANIDNDIMRMPLGYRTVVGSDGVGLSSGQKQRLLIARAVYKNPSLIIFDEATNSLDATNERDIYEKLDAFFVNRTVVVVAHRLNTVCNADNIIVLDKGSVVETGKHHELINKRGVYFKLVQDQLFL